MLKSKSNIERFARFFMLGRAAQCACLTYIPEPFATCVGWVKRSATQQTTVGALVVGSRPEEKSGLDPTYTTRLKQPDLA